MAITYFSAAIVVAPRAYGEYPLRKNQVKFEGILSWWRLLWRPKSDTFPYPETVGGWRTLVMFKT
jgi:hypothetical protein